jgi:dihydroflavonol-4-reductase
LRIEKLFGDITDVASVRRAVHGQEWVIHAAANLNFFNRDQIGQMKVNVDGTRYVAQACREEGIKRLLHVSSVAAIGIPTDPAHPADEDFQFNLQHSGLTYHLSKWRAEKAVLAEVEQGLDAIIVNPSSIFGQHMTNYRLADMLKKVRQTWVVPYFTGGLCVVHVRDVVEGILGAMEEGKVGHRYILGGENLTFQDLVERVAKAAGLRRRFVPVPPAATRLAAMLLEPLGRLLNLQPRITYATH